MCQLLWRVKLNYNSSMFICLCIGDDDTVVYLEEVPLQAFPMLEGVYIYVHTYRLIHGFEAGL